MSSPMDLMQPSMGGTYQKQGEDAVLEGGRRRRGGSRSRKGKKGRKGRGGYLMDVAVAAGLLGATQLSKRRYGYNGPTRRKSRRSRRSSRSRSRR